MNKVLLLKNGMNSNGDVREEPTTEKFHELGSVMEVADPTYGYTKWRYIQAAVAVAAGEAVCPALGGGPTSKMRLIPIGGAPALVRAGGGFAQQAFAIDEYGWIQTKGWGLIYGDAVGVTADTPFEPGGVAGRMRAAAATDSNLGAAGAVVAAATAAAAYIDCD